MERLVISKRPIKGEDGYKVFSIRIKESTVEGLDLLVEKTNRSRNEIINMRRDFALKHAERE